MNERVNKSISRGTFNPTRTGNGFNKMVRTGNLIAMFPVTSRTGHEGLFISVVGKNTTWLNVSY